ncbi:innexin unc-9 [Aplysia californica]|uniref:Innexin n=1 Tax=Aplysia californica TaxID=6500 RepID=A0ABM0K7L7_APLCA|nr:innexin unc-9 [Aplysia californica]WEY19506.1 innexin 16 [Aplysia californica]
MPAANMDSIMNKFAAAVVVEPIKDDDFVDRLHYHVTVAVLFTLTVGSGMKEYASHPIDCWMPPGLTDASVQNHINSYCWTAPLRYPKYKVSAPQNDSNPIPLLEQSESQSLTHMRTAFYRWVTLLFIAQIILFRLPNSIYRKLHTTTDIRRIRDLVVQAQSEEDEKKKEKELNEVVTTFEDWIIGYKDENDVEKPTEGFIELTMNCGSGKKSGRYWSALYLGMKLLNLINTVGNFVLITLSLDFNFWKYGLVLIYSLIVHGDWHDPYNFPRLLMCDFAVEGAQASELTNGNSTSVVFQLQCTMSINELLEKIFAIEWFWLIFLFVTTLVNLFRWIIKTIPPLNVFYFVKDYESSMKSFGTVEKGISAIITGTLDESVYDKEKRNREEFILNYLKCDGVLVLRMLDMNHDRTVVLDIVKSLWLRYHMNKHLHFDPEKVATALVHMESEEEEEDEERNE